MIKIKNKDIVYYFNCLRYLQEKEIQFSSIVQFVIAKNLTSLAPMASIISGIQQKILDNNNLTQEQQNYEISQLEKFDCEMSILHFDLEQLNNLNLSLIDLEALFFMIEQNNEYIQRRKRIMKLTNDKIYAYARLLAEAFSDKEQKLPIKIGFYLQKNKNTLLELAQDIEQSRLNIAKTYGELDEEQTQYIIPSEKMEDVNKELNELFSLEQDVQIYTININDFNDDLTITTAQMEAIMFMVEQ